MTNWIIPCNMHKYDIVTAFEKLDQINWKQSVNTQINDIVYLYLGAPLKMLKYKCLVTEVDLTEEDIDDTEFHLDDTNYKNYGRYMKLRKIDEYENDRLSYDNLKNNGLSTVQGPSKISNELIKYIREVTGDNSDNQFLWININSQVRKRRGDKFEPGHTIEYSWGKDGVPKVRRIVATSQLKPGDQAILVDIEPDSGIFATAEVISEPHKPKGEYYRDKHPDSDVFDLKITKVFEKQPRDIIYELPSFEGVKIKSLLKGVSINKLSQAQYNEMLEYTIENDEDYNEVVQEISFDQPFEIQSLFFENKELIERQIHTAMKQGKNIIFTGPPGTGKSKLAKEVADFYQAEYKMVTASSNWSTYETLGGYHPNKQNELAFKPGLFLTCVKDSLTGDSINQWLIIDELNRSDIDKAFGSFFSVVTGDTVTLPFEAENNQLVRLMPESADKAKSSQEHVYLYPSDWRLIATMNTADKSSLFELSYAFMRRFAFINIGVPQTITAELVQDYLNAWGVSDYPYSFELAQIWSLINKHRQMGPAIIEDLVTYTAQEPNFTDAILMYVMPQLEGMLREDISLFISTLKEELSELVDSVLLTDFVDDFFGDAL